MKDGVGTGLAGAKDYSAVVQWKLNQKRKLAAYEENRAALADQCEFAGKLLRDRLEARDQLAMQKQSHYALQLTKSTVDDSATVRVVTVITLVYLSFTVVAVSRLRGYSCSLFQQLTRLA